ncbi:hypothetical protein ES708_30195 [subsurface metagenome]
MKKKLLITGASSGVGLSLAKYLSKRFHVIAIARRINKLKKIFLDNKNVSTYRIDLADYNCLNEVIDNIIKEHGYIPYLINNAGININFSIENLSKENLENSFYVNAIAPFILLKKLIIYMERNNFGRIINITSGAPLNCSENYAAYSASKAALNALTVTAAKEYRDYNIKINLMSPGPVRTEMAPQALLDPSVCHSTVDYLLFLDEKGPTGKFFWLGYEVPLFPDLEGVNWLEGIGNKKLRKIL